MSSGNSPESHDAAQPREWVVRLGAYLRIFGKPEPSASGYLAHLIALAKERDAEHGR